MASWSMYGTRAAAVLPGTKCSYYSISHIASPPSILLKLNRILYPHYIAQRQEVMIFSILIGRHSSLQSRISSIQRGLSGTPSVNQPSPSLLKLRVSLNVIEPLSHAEVAMHSVNLKTGRVSTDRLSLLANLAESLSRYDLMMISRRLIAPVFWQLCFFTSVSSFIHNTKIIPR